MYKIGDRIRMKTKEELLEFYKNKGMDVVCSCISGCRSFSVCGRVFANSMYKFCGQEFTVGMIEKGGRMYTKERPNMYLIDDWANEAADIIIDVEGVNALI